MSASKDLRDSINQNENNSSTNKTTNSSEIESTLSSLLGITYHNMNDILISDITKMIEDGQKYSLDGYVLCLSRIIKHELAWDCINAAFNKQKEHIPGKYYQLFNCPADHIDPTLPRVQ